MMSSEGLEKHPGKRVFSLRNTLETRFKLVEMCLCSKIKYLFIQQDKIIYTII
jgi:hypothetical protein